MPGKHWIQTKESSSFQMYLECIFSYLLAVCHCPSLWKLQYGTILMSQGCFNHWLFLVTRIVCFVHLIFYLRSTKKNPKTNKPHLTLPVNWKIKPPPPIGSRIRLQPSFVLSGFLLSSSHNVYTNITQIHL